MSFLTELIINHNLKYCSNHLCIFLAVLIVECPQHSHILLILCLEFEEENFRGKLCLGCFLKTPTLHSLRLAEGISIPKGLHPPQPGGRDRVTPLKAKASTQDDRLLNYPNHDSKIFGNFTRSSWCY